MNPAAEGKRYPEITFLVNPERVAAFNRVFGSSRGVPPTFATTAEFAVLPEIVADPDLDLDYRLVVHGSQGYTHHRPLAVGETLRVRSRLESIRVRGGNGFLTIATELVGSDGEIACIARSTMIERAAP